MSDPLFVLAIDGLDIEKARQWTPELLLSTHSELSLTEFDTITTFHIWPTMYCGESAMGRIHANKTYPQRLQQKLANLFGMLIDPVISDTKAGAAKRFIAPSANIAPRKGGRELFEDDCLFSDLKARIVGVPGWNFRDCLDIRFNDESLWETILRDDGVEQCYEILEEELEAKVSVTEEALDYPYDLVWTHIHALDSVQHLFDRDIQREWYERVAEAVQSLINHSNVRGVVILSDHGLMGETTDRRD
ncbi:hypothetical protein VB773_02360 [Haloarculaceae archaeon H-GB2-1]|nr:hypothetical protein [Haloarculaceae archaeon H-GB2-1]